MIKIKTKGNIYENEIYKTLRDFGECKRTLGSGSSDEAGDIHFKTYMFECKRYKEISDWMLRSWAKKHYKDCKRKHGSRPVPLLVYREDRKKSQYGKCVPAGFEYIGTFDGFVNRQKRLKDLDGEDSEERQRQTTRTSA